MRPLFVLFSQKPLPNGLDLGFIASADTYGKLESGMNAGLLNDGIMVVAQFTGDQAATLRSMIETLNRNGGQKSDALELEFALLGFLFPPPEEEGVPDDFDDDMDGHHGSALASAGFGTEEDYGGGGDIDIDIDE